MSTIYTFSLQQLLSMSRFSRFSTTSLNSLTSERNVCLRHCVCDDVFTWRCRVLKTDETRNLMEKRLVTLERRVDGMWGGYYMYYVNVTCFCLFTFFVYKVTGRDWSKLNDARKIFVILSRRWWRVTWGIRWTLGESGWTLVKVFHVSRVYI